jgi:hypothetical protein
MDGTRRFVRAVSLAVSVFQVVLGVYLIASVR